MAIFEIDIGGNKTTKQTVSEMFKYGLMLMIFHIFTSLAYNGPINFGIDGKLFNNNFLQLLILVGLTILAYNLVVEEIVMVT